MSIPKPQGLPDWATGPQAAISEPAALDRARGWIFAQKPPHEWFNWWMNKVYQWIDYLDQLDASGLAATYGGASSNVQAAISDLESRSGTLQQDVNTLYAWGTGFASSINAHSAQADRLERAVSGGVMVNGAPWPNASAASVTVPASGTTWDAANLISPSTLEFGNLTINGLLKVTGIRSMLVFRVHGDLRLNSTILLQAHADGPSATLTANVSELVTGTTVFAGSYTDSSNAQYAGNPASFTSLPIGGAGIMNVGGYWSASRPESTTSSGFPLYNGTRTTTVSGALEDPTRGVLRGGGRLFSGAGMQEHLVRAAVAGSPMAAAPWIGGGGQWGGPGLWSDGNSQPGGIGGGAAVFLVSGDIHVGNDLTYGIWANGTAPLYGNKRIGGGGGGGGALYVYCGGQIRLAQGSSVRPFQACGGNGGAGNSTLGPSTAWPATGGGGGGGGLVFLCARNADANLHCLATGGNAGTLLNTNTTSGNPGLGGRTVAIRALPSMLL